jgi:hypothetical protein
MVTNTMKDIGDLKIGAKLRAEIELTKAKVDEYHTLKRKLQGKEAVVDDVGGGEPLPRDVQGKIKMLAEQCDILNREMKLLAKQCGVLSDEILARVTSCDDAGVVALRHRWDAVMRGMVLLVGKRDSEFAENTKHLTIAEENLQRAQASRRPAEQLAEFERQLSPRQREVDQSQRDVDFANCLVSEVYQQQFALNVLLTGEQPGKVVCTLVSSSHSVVTIYPWLKLFLRANCPVAVAAAHFEVLAKSLPPYISVEMGQ